MYEMQILQNESRKRLGHMPQLWVADQSESGAEVNRRSKVLQKTHQLSFARRNRDVYNAETALIGDEIKKRPERASFFCNIVYSRIRGNKKIRQAFLFR